MWLNFFQNMNFEIGQAYLIFIGDFPAVINDPSPTTTTRPTIASSKLEQPINHNNIHRLYKKRMKVGYLESYDSHSKQATFRIATTQPTSFRQLFSLWSVSLPTQLLT